MFQTLDELWVSAIRRVQMSGEFVQCRNGGSKEVLGFCYQLKNICNNVILNPARKLCPHYASAELLWYLSETTDATMITAYAPSYKNYCNDGHAFGAYGGRWQLDPGFQLVNFKSSFNPEPVGFKSQLWALIHLLREKPETRQAVIVHWNGGDLIHAIRGDKKDLPCTVSMQFLVRNNKLHMVVFMRSNDLWKGMPYDIFCFTTIQKLIADELGLGYGSYTHTGGSLHIYKRDEDKCREATDVHVHFPVGHGYKAIESGKLLLHVSEAIHAEEVIRKVPRWKDTLSQYNYAYNNPLADAVYACGTKWYPELEEGITSGCLRRLLEMKRVHN